MINRGVIERKLRMHDDIKGNADLHQPSRRSGWIFFFFFMTLKPRVA